MSPRTHVYIRLPRQVAFVGTDWSVGVSLPYVRIFDFCCVWRRVTVAIIVGRAARRVLCLPAAITNMFGVLPSGPVAGSRFALHETMIEEEQRRENRRADSRASTKRPN